MHMELERTIASLSQESLWNGESMKILITSDWYYPTVNGVVRSVLNLRKGLMEAGHEVKVLTLVQKKGQFTEAEEEVNQGVYFVPSISAERIYPQARIMKGYDSKAVQELIQWKPDIIHSQCEFSTFFLAERISSKLQIPIVHTYHTVYEDYTHYFSPSKKLGRHVVVGMTRVLTGKVEAVVAPSSKVTEMLEAYGVKCPLYTIPSGIDTGKYQARVSEERVAQLKQAYTIPQDAPVLVFVGRIAKEKNISELIAFMEQLSNDSLYLLIVGGGPMEEDIEAQVKASPASHRIRLTGMVSPEQVQEYYQMGDIFVSASTSETQGLTYIESLANGLPAVCRKDDCLRDVITQGENGFQYTNFEEFQAAITTLLTWTCEERKTRARESARKFSTEVFAQNALRMYEEILTTKPSAPL